MVPKYSLGWADSRRNSRCAERYQRERSFEVIIELDGTMRDGDGTVGGDCSGRWDGGSARDEAGWKGRLGEPVIAPRRSPGTFHSAPEAGGRRPSPPPVRPRD